MKAAMFSILVASMLASGMLASGCSAGSLLGLAGIPKPTPTPQLIVTPSSLTMATTGPTQTQTITASETGSTFFTAQSSDITVATVTPVQNTTNAFSVSALKVGTCTIDVTDENSQTVHVKVTVN
jgi:hypothetical protein